MALFSLLASSASCLGSAVLPCVQMSVDQTSSLFLPASLFFKSLCSDSNSGLQNKTATFTLSMDLQVLFKAPDTAHECPGAPTMLHRKYELRVTSSSSAAKTSTLGPSRKASGGTVIYILPPSPQIGDLKHSARSQASQLHNSKLQVHP